jgi:radical SAM superfamily enzyme YgiQ (UPF0313 family)
VKPDGRLCVKLIHCGNHSLANAEDQCEKNIFFMPMGVFALASALAANGVDAEIINSDSEKGDAIGEILDFRELDAVGFDCHWVNQSLAVIETAELIKNIKPEVFVFLGGFTASLFAEEILASYPQIDAVIRGDAEVPIVELCRVLRRRLPAGDGAGRARGAESFAGVPNLSWRGEKGRIEVNELSYVATAEQLEKLDFASIDLLRNWEYYRKRSIYWTHFAPLDFAPLNLSPMFFLEVGRGCVNGCVFCGGSAEAQRVINGRRGMIWRSVDSVVATMEKAASFGFRTFFTDFEFPGSDEWYRELFRKVEKRGLDIRYVYSSWGLTSRDLIDGLSESFERAFIQLSPETADVDLRRRNKGARAFYTNDELKACLDYIGTKGNLRVQLYFGYFLAFDSAGAVLRTLEFVMELLVEYPDLMEIGYLPFSTDPGSLLFLDPERYDVDMGVRDFRDYIERIRDSYVLRKVSAPDMRLFRPRGISGREVVDLEGKIELFNQLFLSYRKSISYILRKQGGPKIILQLLRDTDTRGSGGTSEEIKERLLDNCARNGMADVYLNRTMEMEYEMQQRPGQQVFKAKPQIWLVSQS